MKNKLTYAMAMILVLALMFTGCGSATPASAPSGSTADGTAKYTMVTGSTGGTYYALGGAMANTLNSQLPGMQISAVSSGASVENMNLLQVGEADLGISMNNIADAAYNGNAPFQSNYENVRTIGVVYHEVYQLIAASSTGATTIADLKGKRVAIGPAGSGTANTSEMVLRLAGIDIAKDITAERDGFGDAAAKMQDGHLDASAAVLSVPAASIIEMTTSLDLNYIDIPDEILEKIQAEAPFYTRLVIPAGTYSNTEDFSTITCQAALYCRKDMSEDAVYEITKAFYENAGQIAEAHTAGRDISLEGALDGITTPLHPGAVKYFKEKGLDIDASLII
ncbi:MAG: TAXI family TRAP transporter solute-binding subunit [Candidatus Fimivivens sp.]